MFNFFKRKGVKQTGFIDQPPGPTDYLGGTLPYEVINESGDWVDYLPQGEIQAKMFTFDTQSCVSFSATNIIEMQLKALTGKEFNFSDRFIAIMSGTTKNGNSFVNVANAIRNYGLIPEEMLPFGGNSFEEYHDRSLITNEMLKAGQEFLKKYDVGYEFQMNDLDLELKHAPLQVAIPKTPYHAIVMPNKTHFFDSYNPFYKIQNKEIAYGFKLVIKEKSKGAPFGILKRGAKGQEVKELQKELAKHIPNFVIDGDFGPTTEKVLKWVQTALNLKPDGIYGNKTKTALELKNWLPVTNFSVRYGDKIEGLNNIVLRIAQRLRNDLGSWVKITSGVRTPEENERVGGAKDSSHLTNLAVDYVVRDKQTQIKARVLLRSYGVVRIGEYADHDHFDLDLSNPQTGWIV